MCPECQKEMLDCAAEAIVVGGGNAYASANAFAYFYPDGRNELRYSVSITDYSSARGCISGYGSTVGLALENLRATTKEKSEAEIDRHRKALEEVGFVVTRAQPDPAAAFDEFSPVST